MVLHLLNLLFIDIGYDRVDGEEELCWFFKEFHRINLGIALVYLQ
jgi:hypothetical protein